MDEDPIDRERDPGPWSVLSLQEIRVEGVKVDISISCGNPLNKLREGVVSRGPSPRR